MQVKRITHPRWVAPEVISDLTRGLLPLVLCLCCSAAVERDCYIA
jgi:hypothetical protein